MPVRIITQAARGGTQQNAALRTLEEERQEQIRLNQEATASAEASQTFPAERSPQVRPQVEGLEEDLGFEPEYAEGESEISRIADDISKRKNQDPQYSNISEVEAQTIPQPTLSHGANTPDQGLVPSTGAQQSGIIAGAQAAEAFPSLDLLAATIPDGVATYNDLDNAIGFAVNDIASVVDASSIGVDPILVQGFNKTREVFDSTEHMGKILSYATFDTLLNRQIINEDKKSELAAKRELPLNDGGITETDYQDKVAKLDDIGINTQQGAQEIFDTASKITAAQLGLPPTQQETLFDHMSNNEKGALANAMFQTLEGNGVLSSSLTEQTWNVTDKFDDVMNSVPDLVRTLNRASGKTTSDIPAPGGRHATSKGAVQKPTGRSQERHEAIWNEKTAVALDFLNNQAFQVYNTPIDLTLSFLQETLYYGTTLSDTSQTDFAILGRNGGGLFTNINPDLVANQPMISEHNIAGMFKLSLADFRKSFNRGRLNKKKTLRDMDKLQAEGKPFHVGETVLDMVFNVVKTDEEMRAIILKLRGGFYGTVSPHGKILLRNRFGDSVDRFNNAASSYNKSPFEGLLVRDKTQYSHFGQIGQSGRINNLDSNINTQSNPGDRGYYISTDSFVVDPSKNGIVEQNAKAIVARSLNLKRDVINTRDSERSGTFEAEFFPRTSDRVEIFDNNFKPKDKKKDAKGNRYADGKPYLDAAELITRFGDPGWTADKIISNEAASALAQAYAQVKETRSGQYTHWFVDAFALGRANPQSGHIVPPSLTDDQWNEVAVVLGVKKIKDGGLVAGNAKEASMHLNALLALARWNKGIPFNGATLLAELDGTNNSIAILSILIGDSDLAETAGLINVDLAELGQILTNGDMRKYVNKKAMAFIPQLRDGSIQKGHSEEKLDNISAMERVLTAIDLDGGEKSAWKGIIMQAAYGKAFGSFGDLWIEEITGDESIIVSQEDIEASSKVVKPILEHVLKPLAGYIQLTQDTGTWASIFGGEYTYISSVGVPVNMAGRQKGPFQKGTIGLENYDSLNLPRPIQVADKQFGLTDTKRVKNLPEKEDAEGNRTPIAPKFGVFTQAEGGFSQNPGQIDEITNAAINHAVSESDGSPEDVFSEFGKLTWVQRNRSPVSPIHAEDAATIIQTVYDVSRMKNPPWFTQTFDAITVNPKSYTTVPDIMNRNLLKTISGIDRYGQDVQELLRMKRDAIKTGDPLSALMLLYVSQIPGAEMNRMKKEIVDKQKRRDDAIEALTKSSSGGDPAQTRDIDYAAFTRDQKDFDKKLKMIFDEYKMSTAFMNRIFNELKVFDAHISMLRSERPKMIAARDRLIKLSKRVSILEDELPLTINVR